MLGSILKTTQLFEIFLSLSKPSETNIENKKSPLSQGNSQLLSQNNFTLSKSLNQSYGSRNKGAKNLIE